MGKAGPRPQGGYGALRGRRALGNFNTGQPAGSAQRATGDRATWKSCIQEGLCQLEGWGFTQGNREAGAQIRTRRAEGGRPRTVVLSVVKSDMYPHPNPHLSLAISSFPWLLLADDAAIYSVQPSLLLKPRLAPLLWGHLCRMPHRHSKPPMSHAQKVPSPVVTDSGHGGAIPQTARNLSTGLRPSSSSLSTQGEPLRSALVVIQPTHISHSRWPTSSQTRPSLISYI